MKSHKDFLINKVSGYSKACILRLESYDEIYAFEDYTMCKDYYSEKMLSDSHCLLMLEHFNKGCEYIFF